MPIYEVCHIIPLSEEQRGALAKGITDIHSEKFTTPRLFVNVVFTDASQTHTYVAGKKKRSNRIIANVRSGPSRTESMYNSVCADLNKLWATTVGTSGDQELRAIFVLGAMIAGSEVGMSIPQAGKDKEWLADNMAVFKKKADGGDEEFKDLLEEIQSRGLVKTRGSNLREAVGMVDM